jgi:hypothetical protein
MNLTSRINLKKSLCIAGKSDRFAATVCLIVGLFLLSAEVICQIGVSILCRQEILQHNGYRKATTNICGANDSDADDY